MVQVICADISSADQNVYEQLYERASQARKQKAGKYRFREDALRCLTADALLRFVLGDSEYTVETDAFGKPYIPEKRDFHYNLSHSGQWVVIAYGNIPVGVDVERIREHANVEGIARRYFTQQEQSHIFEEPTQILERFFEIWTGKESYLKYLGTGLQTDLQSFSVLSLAPDVKLTKHMLPGGYCMSLCSADEEVSIRLLDAAEL